MDTVAVTFWNISLFKSADPNYYLPDVNFTLSELIPPQKPDSCKYNSDMLSRIYSLNEDLGRYFRPFPGQHADSYYSESRPRTRLGSLHEAPLVPSEHLADPHSPTHAGFRVSHESEGLLGYHQTGLQSEYHSEGVGHQIHDNYNEPSKQHSPC